MNTIIGKLQEVAKIAVLAILTTTATAFEIREKPKLLSTSELAAIKTGEIKTSVVGGKIGHGEVFATIKASPERVWAVVTDYNKLKTWYPDMKESVVLEQLGENRVTYAKVDLPLLFEDRDFKLEVKITVKPTKLNGIDVYLMQFNHIKGTGNIVDMFGYWMVYEDPNKKGNSIIRYVINADIGVWLPKPILRWAQSRMFPVMVQNLRKKVE